jgi:hypothetical protein
VRSVGHICELQIVLVHQQAGLTVSFYVPVKFRNKKLNQALPTYIAMYVVFIHTNECFVNSVMCSFIGYHGNGIECLLSSIGIRFTNVIDDNAFNGSVFSNWISKHFF